MPLPSSAQEALEHIVAVKTLMQACWHLKDTGIPPEVIYQNLITMALQYVAIMKDKNKGIPEQLTEEMMLKFYDLCESIKPMIESHIDEISQCGQNKS